MKSIYVAQLVEVVKNQYGTTENSLFEIASKDLSKVAYWISFEVSNTRLFNINRQTRDSFDEKYLIHEALDLYNEDEIRHKCFKALSKTLVDKSLQTYQLMSFSSKRDHHESDYDDVVLHVIVKKLDVV